MREGTLMYTPYVAVAKSLEQKKILITRRKGRIVGFLRFAFSKRKPVCKMYQIFVVPEWRGRGVGSQLLMRLEKLCKQHNIHKIELKTAVYNVKAQRFYEKRGFKKKGIKNGKVQEIIYEKTLSFLGGHNECTLHCLWILRVLSPFSRRDKITHIQRDIVQQSVKDC